MKQMDPDPRVQTSSRRFTKTQVVSGGLIIAVLGIGIGVFAVHIENFFAALFNKSPRDTPIVAGGGSIYGRTYQSNVPNRSDTDGWSWSGNGQYFYASLHPSHDVNPKKVDYVTFFGFNEVNDGTILQDTGGWTIAIANQDKLKNPKDDGLMLSSNAQFKFASCQSDLGSKVHMKTDGSKSRFDGRSNPGSKVIYEVHFHDSESDCDNTSGTEDGQCDSPHHFTVTTCNPLSADNPLSKLLTCKMDGNGKPICKVTIGLPVK